MDVNLCLFCFLVCLSFVLEKLGKRHYLDTIS